LESLRVVQNFLSDSRLRAKYQFSCLRGHPAHDDFNSYGRVHIDWRWFFLSAALKTMIPLLNVMAATMDVTKIMAGENGELKNVIVGAVVKVLAEGKHFAELSELIFVCGKHVEQFASKLEGCWCHQEIWTSGGAYKRRASKMRQATGFPNCMWKGKMLPWWIAEGMASFLAALHDVSSSRLDHMLTKLEEKPRARLLRIMTQLRSRLLEIYADKFVPFLHIPVRLIGIYYCMQGGTETRSKEIFMECANEYDTAVAAGRADCIHRVAHRILDKGTVCRQQLDEWYRGTRILAFFPVACMCLLQYALLPGVERAVEGMHGQIKRAARAFSWALPPFICSNLREKQNLTLLDNIDFHTLCCGRWSSSSMLDELLALRFARLELFFMTKQDICCKCLINSAPKHKIKTSFHICLVFSFWCVPQGPRLARPYHRYWLVLNFGVGEGFVRNPPDNPQVSTNQKRCKERAPPGP
jgi:hypothetical protein